MAREALLAQDSIQETAVRMRRARNSCPWVWRFTHSPEAVIQSPAAHRRGIPTIVTRPRRPRARVIGAQKPLFSLWKVKRSIGPAKTFRSGDPFCLPAAGFMARAGSQADARTPLRQLEQLHRCPRPPDRATPARVLEAPVPGACLRTCIRWIVAPMLFSAFSPCTNTSISWPTRFARSMVWSTVAGLHYDS